MARTGPPPSAPVLNQPGARMAAIVAGFHPELAERLLAGARERLMASGLPAGGLDELWVPGAYEVPLACQLAASSGRYDALLVLGVVIRGETPNFDYICQATITAISVVSREQAIPIGFGLLTVDTPAQAEARAGGAVGNGGVDAADAAVSMLNLSYELGKPLSDTGG